MSFFAIRYPFFILMACMIIVVVGVAAILGMPVDLFPPVKIPVVVVATFYAGMPPQQIESDITDSDERFFTLGSNIDHIESRSMSGVSLIKIYFQPGTDPTAAVSGISNLAMANLRRLPPGTLPPVVLSFDAANLPVCLITLKGAGMNQTQLKDVAQFSVRNQVANVPGASVPQPYGGTYRQIMIYVDPLKLQASQLGVMDVVHAVNDSNLILPAGDVRIGPKDYNIYANSQVPTPDAVNSIPLRQSAMPLSSWATSAMQSMAASSRPTSYESTASTPSTFQSLSKVATPTPSLSSMASAKPQPISSISRNS
jgi:multidrug efflux pump subunit AcrB